MNWRRKGSCKSSSRRRGSETPARTIDICPPEDRNWRSRVGFLSGKSCTLDYVALVVEITFSWLCFRYRCCGEIKFGDLTENILFPFRKIERPYPRHNIYPSHCSIYSYHSIPYPQNELVQLKISWIFSVWLAVHCSCAFDSHLERIHANHWGAPRLGRRSAGKHYRRRRFHLPLESASRLGLESAAMMWTRETASSLVQCCFADRSMQCGFPPILHQS